MEQVFLLRALGVGQRPIGAMAKQTDRQTDMTGGLKNFPKIIYSGKFAQIIS